MHALFVAGNASDLPSELHQALARRGHDVTSVASLENALTLQRKAPVDILLLQWGPAKGTASAMRRELVRATKCRESAVLAVVGPEAREADDALDAGVNDFLSLPLSSSALEARLAVVERWLEQLRGRHTSDRKAVRLDSDFRAILDACAEPICMHRHRRFIYANPALAASMGLHAPQELLGTTILDVVHPDDRRVVEERLAAVERTGEPSALREERFLARDGSMRLGEAHSFLIHMEDGPAIVSLGRDLTERRAVDAQVRHSSRLATVGALTASVAHELNNPLMLVLCNLADLSRTLPSLADHVPAPLIQHVESRVHAIEDAASQMRSLARDLTDFVRNREAETGPVDVKHVLERSLRMVSAYAADHGGVTLTSALQEIGDVQASETRLLQVFLNLLINAVDATRAAPAGQRSIAVTLTREGAEHVVRVTDSGPGVPHELRSRVFDPFFSTKPSGRGTGLGLAVAKSIVNALHGSLTLLDAGPGATFEVRLKAHQAA
jgi:two-component system NtrC family sensor kinase